MNEQQPNEFVYFDLTTSVRKKNELDKKTIFKHSILFLVTFFSVAISAGIFFVGHSETAETVLDLMFWEGVLFAFLLLLFLGVHEFGHYFAAVYHKVEASLPYFIPLPLISPIGTVGAVIKIKDRIRDTIKIYDIGIAGPLAGFVIALGVLLYGFATIPEPEFLNNFMGHEDVVAYTQEFGTFPDEPIAENTAEIIMLGETLLYNLLASFFDNVPPMWEMYHYPWLFAGWLGLFFTALNLMPVGQLDGGHILYSLVGYRKHRVIARIFFAGLITLGSLAAIPILSALTDNFLPEGYTMSWFFWAIISYLIFKKAYPGSPFWILGAWLASLVISTLTILWMGEIRFTTGYGVWLFFSMLILFFIKIDHPPVMVEIELGTGRKILGWLTMLIFILCISPTPFYTP